ncbi:HAD-IIIA family hydrolase [Candidatus Hepatincolaceae symbiont of Richtersius coronifer]
MTLEKLSKTDLIHRLKTVELLCIDADGTLTDGGMYVKEDGSAIRRFYAHDGTGIQMVKNVGVKVAIITTSVSEIMKHRGKMLSLEDVIVGSHEKGKEVLALAKKLNINLQNVVYIGDDVNDILAFKEVGLPIAVSNSSEAVFEFTCYTTTKEGGKGAVREICDLILLAKTGKLYGLPYFDHFIQ